VLDDVDKFVTMAGKRISACYWDEGSTLWYVKVDFSAITEMGSHSFQIHVA